jgi:hypothetical protein
MKNNAFIVWFQNYKAFEKKKSYEMSEDWAGRSSIHCRRRYFVTKLPQCNQILNQSDNGMIASGFSLRATENTASVVTVNDINMLANC